MTETKSTCPYCGVGCGVVIESDGPQITDVRGDPDHPANFGRLCSKGSTLHLTASAAITRQVRLLQPMQRLQRGQAPQASSWDAALPAIADQLADIVERHGPDAVGLYVSGQLLTEDYYVFNKLAKGLLGTNNIDTNSRLCMSSAVAGYKATLGADAPPACYDDLDHAATVFVTGANPAWAHPVLVRRLEDARRANPQQKLVVVDPRRTETAAMADLHLQILPGTDIALCHGLLHLMLWEGWTDPAFIAAHTSGFDALKARVREYTPKETARLTGLREADILQTARWFANVEANGQRSPTLSLYCQGLNQSRSGTAKNAALINLHLACGQIGKPGAGPLSLTGQPNAMGGREVGGLANLLSAHRDLANPAHRAEVAALWGLPSVPDKPGKTAVEMFQAAADGEIKALWIACTNPAQSLPDQAMVQRALQRAELVVLQEAFATTATARFADWLLPATTWGEKDGTVTNSERRISRVRPAIPPNGQARHDWAIARDIARLLEARLRPGAPTLFAASTPEAIWLEHRDTTRGRDLDITGLSFAILDTQGPQQWPMPAGASTGRARLYQDNRFETPDGRARFFDTAFVPLAEPRDARFPFSLTTGRLRDQWHGGSRTGTLGRLFGHQPEPSIDLHAQDMARLRLQDGDLVQVQSRRGSLVLPALASDTIAPAQAHVAMHWGGEVLGAGGDGGAAGGINLLTNPAFCPLSKQPELKHTAVKLQKADLPWRLLAAAWLPEDEALSLRQRLQPLLQGFGYGSAVPFGHARHGLLLRLAAAQPPAPDAVAAIEALFGLGPARAGVLRYADPQRGQRRAIALEAAGDDTRLQAFVLAGDIRAEAWIKDLLQQQLPAQAFGRQLLRPGAQAPVALRPAGRQVCTCLNVAEPAILGVLAGSSGSDTQRLRQLQQTLGCGTQCGSCVPVLQRLVASTPQALADQAE